MTTVSAVAVLASLPQDSTSLAKVAKVLGVSNDSFQEWKQETFFFHLNLGDLANITAVS